MVGDGKKRRPVDPHGMLRSLAGLRSDSAVGFLPVVLSNPKAEAALHDLRAMALRFLDMEFLEAVRPAHTDAAHMFDAVLDVIGYAAFVRSRYRDYAGIHKNLDALHAYLLDERDPDIVNYDLQAFLITLRAAREAIPALAAASAPLAPLLTEERILALPRRSREHAKSIRRLFQARQPLTGLFGLEDPNEVLAGILPLLHEEPDGPVLSYREIKQRLRSMGGNALRARAGATIGDEATEQKRKARVTRRKPRRRPRPNLNYYRPVSPAIIDRVTRAQDYRVWTVPAAIKDLYEQHGREFTRAQRSWLRYARETWPNKSTMRWVPADQDGIVSGYLTQKVIDPVSSPPAMDLIEQAQEAQETIATLLLDVSCSMQVEDRYELTYMIADRLSDFLTKGDVPTEIIGHTTTGETIPNVIGRNRPIHYIIFKMRSEPHNLTTVHRLCSIMHTGMQYFGYDGEAAMWCYERLKSSRAKRRLLFVVTDGDPSGTYLSKKGDDISYFTARHFRDVVASIEAEKRVEIVGVSIKSDVSRVFGRSVRVDSVEDIYGKLSPFILDLLRERNGQD